MGFAAAERFAKEGFQIVLSARNAAKTQALADQLKAKGYKAEVRTVDVSDPSSVAALVAEVEKTFGGIEVVHYNTATMRYETIAEQPLETFNLDLAVNIGGALAAVQAVVPHMSERGSGAILLTGGGYSLKPNPACISLSIGKAGIRALAHGLFESLAQQGVHIGSVTVAASIVPGSEQVNGAADYFWALYSQPRDAWTAELKYTW